MKTLTILSFLFTLATLLGACSSQKYDKVLVRQEGTWNIDKITNEEFEDGMRTSFIIDESGGIYKFNRNKKGFYILGNGRKENFTWLYETENELLTITESNGSLPFEVVEFTDTSQTLLFLLDFFGSQYRTSIELSR